MRLNGDKLFMGLFSGLCLALPMLYFNHKMAFYRDITETKVRDQAQEDAVKLESRHESATTMAQAADGEINHVNLLPLNLVGAAADDPDLINYIRKNMFVAPYGGPPKLNKVDKEHYSQANQSEIVDEILDRKENGFFIECGAAGGESFSNSLFFEKSRGWSGLLVEANPMYFDSIRQKRRVNFVSACLSPSGRAEVLNFTFARMMGGVSDHMDESHVQRNIDADRISGHREITCVPLYSLLLALKVDHVDYFSLDVEGPELQILETIPFDKITIDVLTIEFSVGTCHECTDRKLAELEDFFSNLGNYERYAIIHRQDVVYKRKA